jgi:hypothetical protein
MLKSQLIIYGFCLGSSYVTIKNKVEPVKSLEEAPSIPQLYNKICGHK